MDFQPALHKSNIWAMLCNFLKSNNFVKILAKWKFIWKISNSRCSFDFFSCEFRGYPGFLGEIFKFKVDSRFSRSPDYHKSVKHFSKCSLFHKLTPQVTLPDHFFESIFCDKIWTIHLFLMCHQFRLWNQSKFDHLISFLV